MPSSVIQMLLSIFGISLSTMSYDEMTNAAQLKGFVDPVDY